MATMDRTTLHIVGADSRSRAEQARIAFALGHHAEVYGDLDELLARHPDAGIILAADEDGAAQRLIHRLGEAGIWLPVVLVAYAPTVESAVAGVKAGALDYLALPLEMSCFARQLGAIQQEAGAFVERRRREIEARHALEQLSRREHEVLRLLSEGCSNKEIARKLFISPRTVEIHRGNMMAKLNASHAVDAVRLWMDARTQPAMIARETEARTDIAEESAIAGRIGKRCDACGSLAQDLAFNDSTRARR
jgi:FixJ family two-component response regulator